GYKNGTNTSVKFGYYLKFEKEEAYTLLKNGADTTGMTFSVDLTWDNLGKTIQYNFSSNTVATMANYWLNGSTGVALTLTVTGLENITDQTLVTTPVAHSIDVSITAETANSYKVPFFEIGGTADSDWG
ncbi:MAG: hypothetical protein IJ333_01040, partial [Clostridia bacterium]|nr:hypothetical protein [Clostridia bacterium]